MDIEQQLRGALRPQDPGADFTAAVLQRAAGKPANGVAASRRWKLPLALAASTLVAVIGLRLILQQRAQDRAVEAQQQLVLALEITSAHLNAVQQRLSRIESPEDGI
jgi:hypothetical protein